MVIVKSIINLMRLVGGSIFRKMLLSFVTLIVIAIAVIAITTYLKTATIVEDQQVEYNIKLLKLVGERMDNYIKNMEQVSLLVYLEEVQKMLADRPIDPIESARWEGKLDEVFTRQIGIIGFPGNIVGITLIENGKVRYHMSYQMVTPDFDFSAYDWYKEAENLGGKSFIAGANSAQYQTVQPGNSMDYVFSMARKVNYSNDKKSYGILLMNSAISDISMLFSDLDLSSGQQIMVFDHSGRMLYQSAGLRDGEIIKQSLLTKTFIEKDKNIYTGFDGAKDASMITVYKSPQTELSYVTAVKMSYIRRKTDELRDTFIIVGLLVFIVSVISVIIISRGLTAKIQKLDNHIRKIKNEDSLTPIPVSGIDEIGRLTDTFNKLLKRINTLIETVYKAEIKEKEASLNALQSQINPHFLYNTLDTVSAMSMLGESDKISDLVIALADLFKYGIDSRHKFVTVADELAHLRYYITIQKTRFEDRINFEVDIPEDIMQCRIIKLVIQPLVENAIHHGVEQKEDGGTVIVRGTKKDNKLFINVIDNGFGINSERMSLIKDALSGKNNGGLVMAKGSGIGIINVHERLQLAFGNSYGLDIDDNQGGGTIVTICTPAES